jgi:hypothetical protein
MDGVSSLSSRPDDLLSVKKAVEALKQQPQSPDKKIAFWTAYKTLADEFDKELQEKYGADLDTSLIFVCTWYVSFED